ncbi:MAG: tRNA pseudouridine(55) synthase TruB [Actinobacteria bacterium RBG_16_64_13]|nr:MAG: tRNA pseudouridine(55) synthase TruB [Actinobacteria bacterium RBG_16_64_13]
MVRTARRGVGARVGHAGTLDPFASGLLLILLGQATRISNVLMGLPKEYDLTVQFGAISSTADPTGTITTTGGSVELRQVAGALERFRGRIHQRVPLTSAVKVDGEALYKKAHRGETAETPEREVVVYDLALADFDEKAQTARLLARTASGTYMRALAEDLGAALGAGAYAASLRRTGIGGFSVDDALGPDELSPERYAKDGAGILGLGEALSFLPRYELSAAEARLAANGNELPDVPLGRFRVYGGDELLGIYERLGDVARPIVVFPRSV